MFYIYFASLSLYRQGDSVKVLKIDSLLYRVTPRYKQNGESTVILHLKQYSIDSLYYMSV
jgi:hypothetical protein